MDPNELYDKVRRWTLRGLVIGIAGIVGMVITSLGWLLLVFVITKAWASGAPKSDEGGAFVLGHLIATFGLPFFAILGTLLGGGLGLVAIAKLDEKITRENESAG